MSFSELMLMCLTISLGTRSFTELYRISKCFAYLIPSGFPTHVVSDVLLLPKAVVSSISLPKSI